MKKKKIIRLKKIKAWGHLYKDCSEGEIQLDISMYKSNILKEFPVTILIDEKYLKGE